jgi:hypothetical protein
MTKSRLLLLLMMVELLAVVLLLSSERRDDDEAEVVVEWRNSAAERWTIEEDRELSGNGERAFLTQQHGGVWFVITHVASTRMGGCLPRLCIPTAAINANRGSVRGGGLETQ